MRATATSYCSHYLLTAPLYGKLAILNVGYDAPAMSISYFQPSLIVFVTLV